MTNIRKVATGVLLLAAILFPQNCPAQFANDAKWIPDGANCVVLANGERIFASELAIKENWADLNAGSFERGTSVLPPKVGRMIIASQFDLAYMHPIWTMSVLNPSESSVDLASIAEKNQRPVDTIEDRNAILLRDDVYLIQLDAKNIGAMAPADRQRATRWVASAEARPAVPAPYIAEALSFADKNSHVTIAFDLHGAVDVDSARSRLMNFKSIKASSVEQAAKAISRLRGFMLGITVKDKVYAALRVDFAPGTTGIDAFTKDAIIEALENNGVMIEEIRDWKFSNESGTLMLNGTLSDTGLRQINSLVAQPVQALFRGIGSESIGGSNSEPVSAEVATKRYLNRIEICFKDFDELVKKFGDNAVIPYQRWFSASAEQIDMMSTVNVDPAIVEFGGRISMGFRDISQTLIAAEATAKSQKATLEANNAYGSSYYGYGSGYGYRYRNPALSKQRKAIKAQTYGEARLEVSKIMTELRNDLGTVRRGASSGN